MEDKEKFCPKCEGKLDIETCNWCGDVCGSISILCCENCGYNNNYEVTS